MVHRIIVGRSTPIIVCFVTRIAQQLGYIIHKLWILDDWSLKNKHQKRQNYHRITQQNHQKINAYPIDAWFLHSFSLHITRPYLLIHLWVSLPPSIPSLSSNIVSSSCSKSALTVPLQLELLTSWSSSVSISTWIKKCSEWIQWMHKDNTCTVKLKINVSPATRRRQGIDQYSLPSPVRYSIDYILPIIYGYSEAQLP